MQGAIGTGGRAGGLGWVLVRAVCARVPVAGAAGLPAPHSRPMRCAWPRVRRGACRLGAARVAGAVFCSVDAEAKFLAAGPLTPTLPRGEGE